MVFSALFWMTCSRLMLVCEVLEKMEEVYSMLGSDKGIVKEHSGTRGYFDGLTRGIARS
jgi:hypothetical protein